jgi:ABC-type amino acid transport substrate-binding protein
MLPAGELLAQGTLDRVGQRGEFRIGYREDARPLSYVENGRPAGYSVDICHHIAAAVRERLGREDLRITFVPVTLDSRFDAIVDGDIDIECGSTTVTLGRQERVDFTLMTYLTGGSLLSMADSPVENISDLNGKRVAVIGGTSTAAGLAAYLAENNIEAELMGTSSSATGMTELLAGGIDAYASDQIVMLGDALNAMEQDADVEFHFSSELFSYEPYALMVRRDDADFRLLANRAIAELLHSGEIGALHEIWIGSYGIEIPPMLEAMYQLQALPE